MATWPGTLPAPNVQGYTQIEQTPTIRSPMGYGPAKSRRRTTTAVKDVWFNLYLTAAQKDTLITFYDTTTENGSITFDGLEDYLTGDAVDHRFKAAIQWRAAGLDNWDASLTLEIVP